HAEPQPVHRRDAPHAHSPEAELAHRARADSVRGAQGHYRLISIAEAKNRLTELIRAVEQGENVVITRHGKPVAQLAPAPAARRQVRFDAMRGRIHLKPGWGQSH